MPRPGPATHPQGSGARAEDEAKMRGPSNSWRMTRGALACVSDSTGQQRTTSAPGQCVRPGCSTT